MNEMMISGENAFNVSAGGDVQIVRDRAEAVNLAKSMSLDHPRVVVERDDGMVTMQFSNGSLDTYVFETRGKRRSDEE